MVLDYTYRIPNRVLVQKVVHRHDVRYGSGRSVNLTNSEGCAEGLRRIDAERCDEVNVGALEKVRLVCAQHGARVSPTPEQPENFGQGRDVNRQTNTKSPIFCVFL